MKENANRYRGVILRSATALLLIAAMLLSLGCAAKSEAPMAEPQSAGAYAADMAMEAPAAEEYAEYEEAGITASSNALHEQTAGDAGVRKIIYNADMSITVDAPEQTLETLRQKTEALGGYLSASYTRTDDYGVSRCTATLRVPANKLEELVTAAQAEGKVDDYRLSSDDISLSYYDMKARLESAQAEEAQLLEILKQCETVEEILYVRESLASVRADIESYTAQMNLWDNLVSYATLEIGIHRTPRTAVEGENQLVSIWKASDVWNKMTRGFQNSARHVVNAIGAIGIFLAAALIPATVLFLCIGLPIILVKRRKKRRKAEEAARIEADRAHNAQPTEPEQNEPRKE